MWVTEGVKANPAGGVVLADTGPIGGQSNFTFIIAATVAIAVIVAERNADNTADVKTQVVPAQVGLTPPLTLPVDVAPGGRLVVRTNAALIGSIQAAILRE